jgi:hypothetical protein
VVGQQKISDTGSLAALSRYLTPTGTNWFTDFVKRSIFESEIHSGGVDISSVSGKKPGDHKDSTQGHCIIARPGPKPILNVLIIRGGKSYEGKGAPVQKRSEVRSKS